MDRMRPDIINNTKKENAQKRILNEYRGGGGKREYHPDSRIFGPDFYLEGYPIPGLKVKKSIEKTLIYSEFMLYI